MSDSGNLGRSSEWYPALNQSAIAINREALHFWRDRGFSVDDCLSVCREIDTEAMAAMVSYSASGAVDVRMTQRTWKRQEGHYSAIAGVVAQLARHPNLQGLRGSFIVWLEDGMWARHQSLSQRAPIFAFGRQKTDPFTMLMPDPSYLGTGAYTRELTRSADLSRSNPWSSRIPTVFWRGAATGLGIESPSWRTTQRGRLALLSREIDDRSVLDASLTRLRHLPRERIAEMTAAGIVSDEVPFDEFFRYKYSVDADGYACAWQSLFLKLASGATVLKIDSPFEQWYHRRLEPGKHFLQLSADISNFLDIFAWLQANDSEAKDIAEAGGRFVTSLSLADALHELAFYCWSVFSAQRELPA